MPCTPMWWAFDVHTSTCYIITRFWSTLRPTYHHGKSIRLKNIFYFGELTGEKIENLLVKIQISLFVFFGLSHFIVGIPLRGKYRCSVSAYSRALYYVYPRKARVLLRGTVSDRKLLTVYCYFLYGRNTGTSSYQYWATFCTGLQSNLLHLEQCFRHAFLGYLQSVHDGIGTPPWQAS